MVVLNTKTIQSDKIGFDWVCEYIGEILLTKTYVQQENPVGTKTIQSSTLTVAS